MAATLGVMDVAEAFAARLDVLFVDVREQYEWDGGHIEGSLHIPIGALQARFEELGTERPIVTVCQVGQRSDLAAEFLRRHGRDAHNLEGGLAEWSARGLPLVGAEETPEVVDGWARDLEGRLLDPGAAGPDGSS